MGSELLSFSHWTLSVGATVCQNLLQFSIELWQDLCQILYHTEYKFQSGQTTGALCFTKRIHQGSVGMAHLIRFWY